MRQAVVIIHGIGEQKPMSTLRGFVKSILSVERKVLNIQSSEPDHWVMPDTVSDNYELRKITAKSNDSRSTTDFYEYYWAYNMRDTTFGHVFPWIKTLLLTSPSHIPARLKPVWFLLWLLVGLAGFFFLSVFKDWQIRETMLYSVAGFVLSVGLQVVVIRYLGDAARYLTPDPENIGERHNIRKNGIDLIRKLHDSTRDYQRIIIVGHSLGSVIGYDIITYLWNEYRKGIHAPSPEDSVQEGMIQPKLYAIQHTNAQSDFSKFRALQRETWMEQQALGNKWLISDFITLGSPLAHAQLLMATSKSDLNARISDRELPVCPPVTDQKGLYSYQNYYDNGGRKVWYLHHAAQFACTRWTNLYFPGDLVGGPMAPAFGSGILDIKLRFGKKKWLTFLPTSHTWYWLDRVDEETIANRKEFPALQELYEQLDLGLVR